jgi:hypothetical protein
MDGNLVEVSFLIEGAQEKLSTFISCNSNGAQLRERIYNKACKDLTEHYEYVTQAILKVRITFPFPLSN